MLFLLFTAFGGYYITKRAFRPVNNIVKTANDISHQKDISRRIKIDPNAKEDELHHLSLTLNKMLDKIWTRFYRIDDVRNDEYGSSGLGLSMVKSIIGLHGGEITAKSCIGSGTEFKIVL